MSELFSLKAEVSAESKVFDTVRKAHAWYTSQKFAVPALFILTIIDILGFMQIANATMSERLQNRVLIVSAFAVAFELAPLYIGYAICLKSYKLGQSIHNVVLGLSLTAFILGIIGNGVYRFLTMNIAYAVPSESGETLELSEVALPMTILMFLLPLITSLVNIIIGCLSFDPLLFDLLRLSKKIRKLRAMKRYYESCIEEITNDVILESSCIEDENERYKSAKAALVATRTRIKNYVQVRVASAFKT